MGPGPNAIVDGEGALRRCAAVRRKVKLPCPAERLVDRGAEGKARDVSLAERHYGRQVRCGSLSEVGRRYAFFVGLVAAGPPRRWPLRRAAPGVSVRFMRPT